METSKDPDQPPQAGRACSQQHPAEVLSPRLSLSTGHRVLSIRLMGRAEPLHHCQDASCEQQSEHGAASQLQTQAPTCRWPCQQQGVQPRSCTGARPAGPADPHPARCAPHPCTGPQRRKQEIHPERKHGAGGLLAPSSCQDLPPAAPELAHSRQQTQPSARAQESPWCAPQHALLNVHASTASCYPPGSCTGRAKPLLPAAHCSSIYSSG